MTFPKFDYLTPETIEDACRLLKENKEEAIVMAGGTDLLVKLRSRAVKPAIVIGLKKIKYLEKILFNEKGLTIGAMSLLSSVASHKMVIKHFPSIAYAAGATATVQIRNMGTVAGNLCNASPSADNAPSLMVLSAETTVKSHSSERKIPLDNFFKGPGITALKKDEIVTSIFIPFMQDNSGDSYQRISQRSKVDIPAASVAVMITMNKNLCKNIKVVLGAVGQVPIQAKKTEKLVSGKKLTSALIEEAGIQASKEAKPITDVRASAEYRKEMIAVLFKRAVDEARKRIQSRKT